ncbi:MAG: galactokinase [Spirochaetaceae bacterium]|nr:galactokinase [Spirochaetaceae bacterium]
MQLFEAKDFLNKDDFNNICQKLYGCSFEILQKVKNRYLNAIEKFENTYPCRDEIQIFSASGRTEIGGNHTDHQHGCVLAAAVNLDAIGIVSFHKEKVIRVASEGFDSFQISLSDLSVQPLESGSPSIVRGIVARFAKMGVIVEGFDVYTTSDVVCGSGISSSAAFETLIGTIIDSYYNQNKAGAVEIAKIGQFAENIYFGKKSGLMDQMVSSVGGLVFIDFNDTENPVIANFEYDFNAKGYSLCITDTKGSHANLTRDYVAIREEMENVAYFFGKQYLRQVDEAEFWNKLPEIRKQCSDRAINRAIHFFEENQRAIQEAEALKADDLSGFLKLVQQSGDSSIALLQNLYSISKPTNQELLLGIAVSKKLLEETGAVRVHGGGFAGTIQAFVPKDKLEKYLQEMDRIYGKGSCHVLSIRSLGGTRVL